MIDAKTYEDAVAAAYARGHAQGMVDMSNADPTNARVVLAQAVAKGVQGVIDEAVKHLPEAETIVLRALAGLL